MHQLEIDKGEGVFLDDLGGRRSKLLASFAWVDFALAEPLFDEEHELLLAFVSHLHVFDELTELYRSIVGQQERFPCFG